MTIVLCGVGADAGNVAPALSVGPDGAFDYVPIPEKCATTERATYGSLHGRDGAPLADLIDRLEATADGRDGTRPEVIEHHPVHRDPNFAALTYGEHRPAYVARLRDLDPDDAVAFYTGFRKEGDGPKRRYLMGYFTVAAVTVVAADAGYEATREALADHPENAHTKRFRARGSLYYDDKDVVIVDGRAPGGLLDRAVRLTDRIENGMHVLAPSVAATLSVAPEQPVSLGGFKPAIECDASTTELVGFVENRLADDGARR